MGAWCALEAELGRWVAAGRRATLWWRDDDAREPSPALDRLLALVQRSAVPLGLAVVPEGCGRALAARLRGVAEVRVLLHGWSHLNHAPAGAKSSELGGHRPLADEQADLGRGLDRLRSTFADRLLPVLVPPWNRISPALVASLPRLGLRGLSTFAPRTAASPCPGLVQVNTHVDPVAWRAGRGFRGAWAVLGDLVAHLAARREGRADADEPTGILTHHLDHDAVGWAFVERLVVRLAGHPAVRWPHLDQLLVAR